LEGEADPGGRKQDVEISRRPTRSPTEALGGGVIWVRESWGRIKSRMSGSRRVEMVDSNIEKIRRGREREREREREGGGGKIINIKKNKSVRLG
jgi:hypothetical protein